MGTVGSSGDNLHQTLTANTNKHLRMPVPSFPEGLIRLFCLVDFYGCSSLSLGGFQKEYEKPPFLANYTVVYRPLVMGPHLGLLGVF